MHTITILMDECGQEEKDLHNEFARLHPQVNIHFEYVNEVRKNMILMDKYKSRILPDIIQLGSSNIPYLTDKGLLLDLTPWLEREMSCKNANSIRSVWSYSSGTVFRQEFLLQQQQKVFFITKAGLTKPIYHTRTMIGLGKIFYRARFTSIIAMQ